MLSSLNHNVENGDKWVFDQKVAHCFEDMLQRSIPEYATMRALVFDVGRIILDNHKSKNILDLGCSNGVGLEDFAIHYKDGNILGIDTSIPMLELAAERMKNHKNVHIKKMDLRKEFPNGKYQLITSILTIQFIPIEYRQNLIKTIYDSLNANGAFIFVEKVLGNDFLINDLLTKSYLQLKQDNGYSQEQVCRKKASLEGVLVPITSNWNRELLRSAGFKQIDTFWRHLNFEGFIAIK